MRMIRPKLAKEAARTIRWMAAREVPRWVLNRFYSALSLEQQERFHTRFAKIFRNYQSRFEDGEWSVTFAGKRMKIPLIKTGADLDWDVAISVAGHDGDIKRSYKTLLRLKKPPRLFLDIGTNYGTHSILFLSHGVQTISFEPNVHCNEFFRKLCEANGFTCRIEPLAVGAGEDTLELWFPESEEWLGTTDPATQRRLECQCPLIKLAVRQTTLDHYVQQFALKPDLIKIDTEGTEDRVFEGAQRTLADHRPLAIFESWAHSDRAGLQALLKTNEYHVCCLPVLGDRAPEVLNAERFKNSPNTNFIAIPAEVIKTWPPQF